MPIANLSHSALCPKDFLYAYNNLRKELAQALKQLSYAHHDVKGITLEEGYITKTTLDQLRDCVKELKKHDQQLKGKIDIASTSADMYVNRFVVDAEYFLRGIEQEPGQLNLMGEEVSC